MKKLAFSLSLGLLLCGPMAAQQSKTPNYNGAWWGQKSHVFHEAWVSGYKSGLHQGEGHDTELTKFGPIELVDGLDKFYSDFRNRNINVHDALPFVAAQLSGAPDEKLNAQLLKLRAAAAGSAPAD
jgi:hypothetical protein